MQLRYKVHSAAQGPVQKQATLPGGQVVDATVPGLAVELLETHIQADGGDAVIVPDGNTITLRFVPDGGTEGMAAAMDLFAVDRVLTLTLE